MKPRSRRLLYCLAPFAVILIGFALIFGAMILLQASSYDKEMRHGLFVMALMVVLPTIIWGALWLATKAQDELVRQQDNNEL